MHTQSGSAFVYILIAIALLAALTVTTMQSSSQSSQTQNATKVVSQLNSQIGFIQSAVQECVISHPGGAAGYNTGDNSNNGSGTWGANAPYPVNPNAAPLMSNDTDRKVKNIRCPGDHPSSDSNDHADIFGGSSGRFLPPAPDLFKDWKWYNGKEGVFFWIATEKSDPFIETAFDKLNEKMADCQVDWNTNLGMPADDDGDDAAVSTPDCTTDEKCLRYWMVINSSGSPVHKETSCQ